MGQWQTKAKLKGPTGAQGKQGPQGLAGVNAVENDTAVAGYISTTGTSETQTALDARYAHTNVQGFTGLTRKLEAGIGPLSWLHVSDSTSVHDWSYVRTVALQIAAAHPAWKVVYRLWDSVAGTDYAAPEVMQAGIGTTPPVFSVWNASMAGQNTLYVQGARWANAVLQPGTVDAFTVSHGFNEPTSANLFRDRLIALVESVRAVYPHAETVLIAENPNRDNTTNTILQFETAKVARLIGAGFCDINRAFLNYPDMASLYNADDPVHPTGPGNDFEAALLYQQFVSKQDSEVRSQRPSSLLSNVRNLVPAGNFPANWDGTSTPTGLVRTTNLAWSKNTTDYETKGYSIQAVASAASQYISATVDGRPFRGKVVTLAARIKIISNGATDIGRISIADGITTATSQGDLSGQDGWRWAVVSGKIGDTATSLIATMNITTSGASAATVLIDRFVVCLGLLPADSLT